MEHNEGGNPPQQNPELTNRSTLGEMQQVESGRELADFIHRADALQYELSAAATRQSSDALDVSGELQLEPTLHERYDAAQYLMSAVKAVLDDEIAGKNPLAKNAGYLVEKIGVALAPYGLKVVEDEEPDTKQGRLRARGYRRLERESIKGAPHREIPDDGTQDTIMNPQDGGNGTRR